eukprot:TRINITY_DN13711_c0_g1_i7.p1 TRINITY_DN13711_c0_g1~~TRINITY_DN13711_c0_g1_i7.p1  ORF type:complete len:161 (+),score=16.72 TRINITY_DN13711_c0_g1_i7:151-633(+)
MPSTHSVYYFKADSKQKIVTHKPVTLCVTISGPNGKPVIYSLPTKISESKIKRRCNTTRPIEAVWVDSSKHTVYTSLQETIGLDCLKISPETRVAAGELGFLFFVETKGGKTDGRQKQRYVLLRRSATYRVQSPADRKSGSAGMPRPISYAVFCLKKKKK